MWDATLILCPGLRQLSSTSRWGRLFRRGYAVATSCWMDRGGAGGFDSGWRIGGIFLLEEQRLQGICAAHNRTAHKRRNWRGGVHGGELFFDVPRFWPPSTP